MSGPKVDAWLQTTIENIDDGVLAADMNGNVLFCNEAAIGNPAFSNMSDTHEDAALCLYLADQSTPCTAESAPLARARKGETVRRLELFARTGGPSEGRWFVVNAAPLIGTSGVPVGSIAVARDVTAAKTRESELKQLLLVDELTGLCNRRAFLSLAAHQLVVARRTERPVALFFVDLDGLKEINDDLGHDKGDDVLREASTVLRESFRRSDIVARLGGDEFAVLALDADLPQVESARDRLVANIEEANARNGRAYRLSMSVGACVHSPVDPESLEALLVRADGAMYEEKRRRHASRPPRLSGPPSRADVR